MKYLLLVLLFVVPSAFAMCDKEYNAYRKAITTANVYIEISNACKHFCGQKEIKSLLHIINKNNAQLEYHRCLIEILVRRSGQ